MTRTTRISSSALFLVVAAQHQIQPATVVGAFTCYVTVYNLWKTDLVISTYNDGDVSCVVPFNTWTAPKGQSKW
jgi:hypothetical protein